MIFCPDNTKESKGKVGNSNSAVQTESCLFVKELFFIRSDSLKVRYHKELILILGSLVFPKLHTVSHSP